MSGRSSPARQTENTRTTNANDFYRTSSSSIKDVSFKCRALSLFALPSGRKTWTVGDLGCAKCTHHYLLQEYSLLRCVLRKLELRSDFTSFSLGLLCVSFSSSFFHHWLLCGMLFVVLVACLLIFRLLRRQSCHHCEHHYTAWSVIIIIIMHSTSVAICP